MRGCLIALGGRPRTRTWTSRPVPSGPLPSLAPAAGAPASLALGVFVSLAFHAAPLRGTSGAEPPHRRPLGLAVLSLPSPDSLVRSWLRDNALRKRPLPPTRRGALTAHPTRSLCHLVPLVTLTLCISCHGGACAATGTLEAPVDGLQALS